MAKAAKQTKTTSQGVLNMSVCVLVLGTHFIGKMLIVAGILQRHLIDMEFIILIILNK